MSKDPLSAKIAEPYARALYDFSVQGNIMHEITADFRNLEVFLTQTPDFVNYLSNPLIAKDQKAELLDKTLKKEVNVNTLKFLNVLIERDRINLLETVIENYLALIYDLASVKIINVTVAEELRAGLESALLQKLEELTNAREIRLVVTVDPSIIAGMIIKTKSQVIDFSYRNKLRLLAKHLDSVLEF
jgi:F-type H+-transporting ATPase subunit delta